MISAKLKNKNTECCAGKPASNTGIANLCGVSELNKYLFPHDPLCFLNFLLMFFFTFPPAICCLSCPVAVLLGLISTSASKQEQSMRV